MSSHISLESVLGFRVLPSCACLIRESAADLNSISVYLLARCLNGLFLSDSARCPNLGELRGTLLKCGTGPTRLVYSLSIFNNYCFPIILLTGISECLNDTASLLIYSKFGVSSASCGLGFGLNKCFLLLKSIYNVFGSPGVPMSSGSLEGMNWCLSAGDL